MKIDKCQFSIGLIFLHLLHYSLTFRSILKMKHVLKILLLIVVCTSCNSQKKSETQKQSGIHKVIVQEVLHVNEYSYLRVLEDGIEKWLAVPSIVVEIGKTYYHGTTMEMNNFESKGLNKTFETIFFVENLSTDANETAIQTPENIQNQTSPNTSETPKSSIEKNKVTVETPGDRISIAELFENKEKYKDKLVKLSGKVAKYNPAIMNINWVHIQDGTDFNGEFDLTITTNEVVQIGETITILGKVTLNKDFGAGYFYKIIIENAILINE